MRCLVCSSLLYTRLFGIKIWFDLFRFFLSVLRTWYAMFFYILSPLTPTGAQLHISFTALVLLNATVMVIGSRVSEPMQPKTPITKTRKKMMIIHQIKNSKPMKSTWTKIISHFYAIHADLTTTSKTTKTASNKTLYVLICLPMQTLMIHMYARKLLMQFTAHVQHSQLTSSHINVESR